MSERVRPSARSPAAEGQTSSHEIPRWALSGPVHACAEVNSAALVSSA
jgi:hypothetical protein